MALLVLPLAQETSPAEASKKVKTVKTTFANGEAITSNFANPASPYPATIQVSGLKKGKIKDVNLSLHGFGHDNPDSVDAMLVAPNGNRTLVMSDVGGSSDVASLTLTLDDEAATALPDGGLLGDGTFLPTNVGDGDTFPLPASVVGPRASLSLLNGGKPNGEWQLFVTDGAGMGQGSIDEDWSLVITAKVKRSRR